jgi:hypothetical protein
MVGQAGWCWGHGTGGNPWAALLSTTRTTLPAPFPFSKASVEVPTAPHHHASAGRNPLVPLTDDGGVETSLSFLKASSWVLQRCWSNSGVWRWHDDSGRFSLLLLRPTALVRCCVGASGGGVLGVALWASLVAALGGIALCSIVFLGELLCLPTVRRPTIQGEGQGVLSGGEVNGALSLLPSWCSRRFVPGGFP